MFRKRKFIVQRRTWYLHQFEFSGSCSYHHCLTRLKNSKSNLDAAYRLEIDGDTATFELHWDTTTILGTLQYITDETTLFVGIAYFRLEYENPGSLTILAATFLLLAIGFSLLPVMGRGDLGFIFTPSGIKWTLACLAITSTAALFLYLPARFNMDSKVNELRSNFDASA